MLSREWQKSSRSQPQGDCVELRLSSEWKKSSRSASQGNCVELRQRTDTVQIRDTKLGDASPVFDLDGETYACLIEGLKRG